MQKMIYIEFCNFFFHFTCNLFEEKSLMIVHDHGFAIDLYTLTIFAHTWISDVFADYGLFVGAF